MTIYHTHHIVPKHMGGTDDPSNLIRLTVEEHAEAHRNLYEEYGKIEDLWAVQLLSNQISYEEGFQKLLVKNAKDTHEKMKQRGTGLYDSHSQSKKGKKAAVVSNLGKPGNNSNEIKLSCIACRKSTSLPTFSGHHLRKCF